MKKKYDPVKGREARLQQKYGISSVQYNELLRWQGGKCAVCGQSASHFKVRLHVEHNHKNGHIRGLVCWTCNRIIEMIDKFPARIQPALDHVAKDGCHLRLTVPDKKRKSSQKKKK